jgi:large subunit ribosomal protein L10
MSQAAIEKKSQEVATLVEKMKATPAVVMVNYRGLTVEEVTELRGQLYDSDCELKVIKNNITRRAVESLGYDGIVSDLVGPNAVAFSNSDSVAAAKVLYEFAKDHPALELKSGIVDGEVLSLEHLQQLAQIPSREALLTMFAGGLIQPIKQVAIGLNMHIENLESTQ